MKPEEINNDSRSTSSKLTWKKLIAKKWFFPAAYVATTALILSVAWWYQGEQLKQVSNLDNMGVTEPADVSLPQMILPVTSDSQAERKVGFYDDAVSTQEKQVSLVKYANTYWPHTGCDFARKDGATFDVIAACDGKVIQVNENPVVGRQVEIQRKDGLVTVYQSLADIQVQKGQPVQKGLVIGKAGYNTFEKELGNHLHFEIRKNNTAENPEQYFKSN